MATKADFVGTWTLNAAGVDAVLRAGGLEGQQFFQAMWPYGQTTSTGEPTIDLMDQAYIVPDLDAVEVIMAKTGIRAHSLMDTVVANDIP